MKKLILAIVGVIFMIYLGFDGMENQMASGPFFMFVGVCTSIGLFLDIMNVIRQRLRKSRLEKLSGR
jgi:hypothetical protein